MLTRFVACGVKTAARLANVRDSRFLPLAIFAFNVGGAVLRLGRAIEGENNCRRLWGAAIDSRIGYGGSGMADVKVGDGR